MQQQRLDEKLILRPSLCLSVCLSVLLCDSCIFLFVPICCINMRQRGARVYACSFMHAHGPVL